MVCSLCELKLISSHFYKGFIKECIILMNEYLGMLVAICKL